MTKQTVYYKKLTSWIDPEEVFVTLFADEPQAFWLDSSLPDNSTARFSYMGANPTEMYSYSLKSNIIRIQTKNDTYEISQNIFSFLEEHLKEKNIDGNSLPFPFVGGFVGYFGYELKALTGAITHNESPYPDSLWYLTEKFIVFDHANKNIFLAAVGIDEAAVNKWFEEVNIVIASEARQTLQGSPRRSTPRDDGNVSFQLTRDHKQYLKDIESCKQYLKNGESYQICLTNTLTANADIDPLVLYCILRKDNPAPYAAFIKHDELAIISSSPEQFLTVDKNRWATSKPIKGTIRRGDTPLEDADLAKQLTTNEKENAENLMIVDLVRNDLGKVSKIGSVSVPTLMAVESYATVHQLVSTVKGKLKDDASVIDCIKACFPGGSMTGAPKLRTMEIIDILEKKARGIYSGCIGFLSFSGTATLNIAIRTIVLQGKDISIGAGGAVLIQSDPEKEYDEMLLKAKALVQAVNKAAALKRSKKVFLALGSNVGNKKQNIQTAIERLQRHISGLKAAKLYESKPMYFEDQEQFVNTVVSGFTTLSPQELLQTVKLIEKELGRIKRFRNGPREIDIDILFYDDLIHNEKDLVIPHPGIRERNFVLKPFMDLEPGFVHPVLKKTMRELYNDNKV